MISRPLHWVLAALEWWLPPEIGPALVGDLAEEGEGRSGWWVARQALDAAIRVPIAQLRSRRVVAAGLCGAGAAALVYWLGDVAWHGVLAAVPRRAWHEPGLGWRFALAVLAGGAATAASWGYRSSTGRRS